MNKYLLVIFLLITILSSCASKHSFMRGTVVMKIDSNHANICMGNQDVSVGTPIEFFIHHCNVVSEGEYSVGYNCTTRKLGVGTVTKLLNSHYSSVTTNGDFKFDEGTLVQKVNK